MGEQVYVPSYKDSGTATSRTVAEFWNKTGYDHGQE